MSREECNFVTAVYSVRLDSQISVDSLCLRAKLTFQWKLLALKNATEMSYTAQFMWEYVGFFQSR